MGVCVCACVRFCEMSAIENVNFVSIMNGGEHKSKSTTGNVNLLNRMTWFDTKPWKIMKRTSLEYENTYWCTCKLICRLCSGTNIYCFGFGMDVNFIQCFQFDYPSNLVNLFFTDLSKAYAVWREIDTLQVQYGIQSTKFRRTRRRFSRLERNFSPSFKNKNSTI